MRLDPGRASQIGTWIALRISERHQRVTRSQQIATPDNPPFSFYFEKDTFPLDSAYGRDRRCGRGRGDRSNASSTSQRGETSGSRSSFLNHDLLIVGERLREQQAEGVRMPEGMPLDELALRVLIAAETGQIPSLR
jgi:hypothetical protein